MPGVGHAARRKAPSIGACTEMLHAEWPRLSGLAQNGQEKTASPAAASPVEHRVPAGAVLRVMVRPRMVRNTDGVAHGRNGAGHAPDILIRQLARSGARGLPLLAGCRSGLTPPARQDGPACPGYRLAGRSARHLARTRMGAGGVVYWGSGREMQTPLPARAAPLQGAGRFMAGRFRAGVSAPESASSAGTSAGGRPADARACCPAGSR